MFSLPFLNSLTDHLGVSALDDPVDTLSCLITAFIFIFSAILISAKTYVGSPIECWLPQTYSGEWGEFSENYCFLKDTYWYPADQPMGDIPAYHKEEHRLQYYQWSSMYLTIAALVFMIPKFIWKLSQSATDMPILYFCETTQEICKETPAKRNAKVREMAELLHSKITARHTSYSLVSIRPCNVHACIKILYAVISVAQFVMLSIFLGQKLYLLWGWELAMNLLHGITWETTGLFPRITFCDFSIREMAGNNREETIQCVIGVNEFNEKIFLFLWFWLVFVLFFTISGNLYLFTDFRKKHLICSLLHKKRRTSNEDEKRTIKDFAKNYLTRDGQLVLKFIKSQSDVVASELAEMLFDTYLNWRGSRSRSNGDLEMGETALRTPAATSTATPAATNGATPAATPTSTPSVPPPTTPSVSPATTPLTPTTNENVPAPSS